MPKLVKLNMKTLEVKSFSTSNHLKGGVPQTNYTNCDGRDCSFHAACDYSYNCGKTAQC